MTALEADLGNDPALVCWKIFLLYSQWSESRNPTTETTQENDPSLEPLPRAISQIFSHYSQFTGVRVAVIIRQP